MKDSAIIKKLGDQIDAALKLEIAKTRIDDEAFTEKIFSKLPFIRQLAHKHLQVNINDSY